MNDEVLENLDKIKLYPIKIDSEEDLGNEIARIANLFMVQGYRLEDRNPLLSKEEAYQQLGYSDSLFRAVFGYAKRLRENLQRTEAVWARAWVGSLTGKWHFFPLHARRSKNHLHWVAHNDPSEISI